MRDTGWIKLAVLAIAFALAGGTAAASSDERLPPPEVGEDGLHRQNWFQDTFLDLNEDIEEARAQNKRLVLIWEQRGCPYCRATHQVNFRIPKIVDYVSGNFFVLQMNLWGDREVTDFDGETLSEKALARKYKVLFTPTFQFFPETLGEAKGKPGDEAEVLRIPGYFKPFHFYYLFRYANEKGYEKEPSFQRWLDAQGDRLRAKGVNVEEALWKDTLELPEGE